MSTSRYSADPSQGVRSRLSRRTLLAGSTAVLAAATSGIAIPTGAAARSGRSAASARHGRPSFHLPSRPDTVAWGYMDAALPPVLHVAPGDVVTIDTLSHQGMINGSDPAAFFGAHGIARGDVLQDAIDVYAAKQPEPGMSVHVLTGPVFVEGAEPGDVLEVRVLDSRARVPYGVNKTGPGSGVLPDLLDGDSTKVIELDLKRKLAAVADGVRVPIDCFQGIMCTAPAPELGKVSSRPPGAFGGNMDLRDLTAGCTLYLPVFNDGALFSTGDGHTAQGDGEVDGTAIETSLTSTFQFFVHKQVDAPWPMAESRTHFISMGIDTDLDTALAVSLQQAVTFLTKNMGLSAADAYTLCSVAVDFEIAEAVNYTKVVHGKIPKAVFAEVPRYWAD
ncbi:amidase [Streptomyces sulfonofaciens]|uniref:Amidase n=1 Tax=Streptomyces sulfonofaciens TaxID=68272 RepID=A0A919FMW2_9ACTN|nr:acetamidase/formamidase family protein [Streptomyces sulfonofaciens]GHH68881.1 amidase [Streptomyces sulfonofaciens]